MKGFTMERNGVRAEARPGFGGDLWQVWLRREGEEWVRVTLPALALPKGRRRMEKAVVRYINHNIFWTEVTLEHRWDYTSEITMAYRYELEVCQQFIGEEDEG